MQIAVARQSENEENTVIRRLSTFVLTLVALVSFVNVGHAQQPLMTRHTREEVASRAVPLVGHMSATQNLRIVLVLQHRNQSELDQLLSDLYDSSSPVLQHRNQSELDQLLSDLYDSSSPSYRHFLT